METRFLSILTFFISVDPVTYDRENVITEQTYKKNYGLALLQ